MYIFKLQQFNAYENWSGNLNGPFNTGNLLLQNNFCACSEARIPTGLTTVLRSVKDLLFTMIS